jgi:hypothetical protein
MRVAEYQSKRVRESVWQILFARNLQVGSGHVIITSEPALATLILLPPIYLDFFFFFFFSISFIFFSTLSGLGSTYNVSSDVSASKAPAGMLQRFA